jgi:hypothetical protein
MANFKVIHFKSEPRKTRFAPEWSYYIFETEFNKINFKDLAKFFLKKEKEILKLPDTQKQGVADGYTGLGKNTTSSKYDQYNVFKWKHKELTKIKKQLIVFHNSLIKILKHPNVENLYIQSWINIMKKGQKITPHIHNTNPDSYLSGNINIQNEDTPTFFMNPVNQINDPELVQCDSKVGKLNLFQSCLPHFCNEHISKETRITLAFDLTLEKRGPNYLKII